MSSAGRTPPSSTRSSARASPVPTPSSRSCAPSSPAGSAARPAPGASSASTPTRRSRSPVPATRLGDRILAEAEPLWPGDRCCSAYDRPMVDLELARHQWDEGRRAVERAQADARDYRSLTRRVDVVTAELTRRIGQTFTLAELAAVYDGVRPLGARDDRRRVPRRMARRGLDGCRRRVRPLLAPCLRLRAMTVARPRRPSRAGAAAGRGTSPVRGGIALVFLAGVGLGEALHDNPGTGGTQTVVRTLHPLPLVPVARTRSR